MLAGKFERSKQAHKIAFSIAYIKKKLYLCSRFFCVSTHFFRENGIYFANVYDFLRNPVAYYRQLIIATMIITTTPTIEGHQIKEYKGLVSGEVVFGMNFVKDFFAGLHDFFGGRSGGYEESMIKGRQTAQKEMEEKAAKLGANAIVGVSYGYETMGQGGSMLMIAISGTAVVID